MLNKTVPQRETTEEVPQIRLVKVDDELEKEKWTDIWFHIVLMSGLSQLLLALFVHRPPAR